MLKKNVNKPVRSTKHFKLTIHFILKAISTTQSKMSMYYVWLSGKQFLLLRYC